MIEIKKKDGTRRLAVEISDQSIYRKELMAEEYVLLSFASDTAVPFAKGDYIETEFGTFTIVDIDKPSIDADGAYKYEQKFHAAWERFKTHIMFYDRQQGAEKAWKMTQRPEYFLDILVSNVKSAGFGQYSYAVDASLTGMKLLEFDATSLLDALTKIAEAWETEWWITDNVIHLGKCEYGSAVSLTEGDEINAVEASEGSDTEYITRLYAFGSTRNLRKDYRKEENNDAVIEGIVETRLKLPAGVPYVDAWPNMADEDIVEGVAIFEGVYPHRVGSIASVSTKEYTDTIENEDGTTTQEKWNAYRFTDGGLTFSKEYVIEGEELRLTFQSGKLAGMDFAVTFNPDGLSESDTACQVFEIVRNEDYGLALPSDAFSPAVGDTYVLYGYDTRFVADTLEGLAESELYDKAVAKVAETSKDKSVYDCPTNPIRCAGYKPNNKGGITYNSANVIDLDMGQRVTLHSDTHIAGGSRTSRVRAFEKKLADKFTCTYTIGESATYSQRAELNEKVEELTYQSKQFVSTGGSSLYAIKYYDNTAPTDHNVYSAKRADKQFARKDKPDTFQGVMTFKDGAAFGDFFESIYAGVGAGIDAKGNAEFESVRVRSFFECLELIINRQSAIEGDQVLTEGDTVERVEALGNKRYRLHLKRKWEGYFTAQAVNNVIKGVVNTLAAGSGTFFTSWMRVESVNTADNCIEVTLYPDADTPAGQNFEPVELMNIVRWGNQTDTRRQSCIYLSSSEGRFVRLTGVTAPKLTAANYGATLGTLPEFLAAMNLPTREGQDYLYARGLVVQDIIRLDYQGQPQATIVDRGEWMASETYYCNALNPDTQTYETSDVWYYGCRYRCASNGTTSAPAWGNTDWAMVEGNPDVVAEFVEQSPVCNPANTTFKATLTLVVKAYNQDITAKVSSSNVSWTRYSEDAAGNPRTALDEAWNNAHKNAGKALSLTLSDIDVSNGTPSVVRFTASVTPGVASASADVLFVLKGDKGDTGAAGQDGADGRGIVSTTITYGWSLSNNSMPTSWSSTMPTVGGGMFLWTRTEVTYTTGEPTVSYTYAKQGSTGDKGDKGERGAALRGPRYWDDIPSNEQLYSGADGEAFLDVVIYNDQYYVCKSSVPKQTRYSPANATTAWQLGDKVDLVATKILLAEYSIIKNLGVESIEMKDSNGNVVFLAKDGVVTCKTGTFDNVNIQSGNIAGFNIQGKGLINEGFDSDAYILFRNDTTQTFVSIGGNTLPATAGASAVARFENGESNPYGLNIGAYISATGAKDNIALHLAGGCISGLAMRNQIITGTTATYIQRGINNIVAMGNGTLQVYLPQLKSCDDGYVLRVQSLKDSGSIRLLTQNCETLSGTSKSAIICYVDGKYTTVTTGYFDLSAPGYAMELVWFRDMTVTTSYGTYNGVWLQYKMPRDW